MGTQITWEELINNAYASVMLADDGSPEELAALEHLERLQEYALDSMLVGRVQEGPCAS